jgi:hypothetical protein
LEHDLDGLRAEVDNIRRRLGRQEEEVNLWREGMVDHADQLERARNMTTLVRTRMEEGDRYNHSEVTALEGRIVRLEQRVAQRRFSPYAEGRRKGKVTAAMVAHKRRAVDSEPTVVDELPDYVSDD